MLWSLHTGHNHNLSHSKPLVIKEEKGLLETYNHNRHPMNFIPVDNNTLHHYASRGTPNSHSAIGQDLQTLGGRPSGPAPSIDINSGGSSGGGGSGSGLVPGYHHHASPYYHHYSHPHHLSMNPHHHQIHPHPQRFMGAVNSNFQDFSATSITPQCTSDSHHLNLLPPLTSINDYSTIYSSMDHHHYHSNNRQYSNSSGNTFPHFNGSGPSCVAPTGYPSPVPTTSTSNGNNNSKGSNLITEGGNGSKSGRNYDFQNQVIHQSKNEEELPAGSRPEIENGGAIGIELRFGSHFLLVIVLDFLLVAEIQTFMGILLKLLSFL